MCKQFVAIECGIDSAKVLCVWSSDFCSKLGGFELVVEECFI